METQTIKRQLKYEFSTQERSELGNELSLKVQEMRRLEDEKSSVTSDYGSRIKICKEQLNTLSDKVSNGYEVRETVCECEYHVPERNKKTIKRLDTDEIWIETMLDYDHNLFNQWEEKERQRLAELEKNGETETETETDDDFKKAEEDNEEEPENEEEEFPEEFDENEEAA